MRVGMWREPNVQMHSFTGILRSTETAYPLYLYCTCRRHLRLYCITRSSPDVAIGTISIRLPPSTVGWCMDIPYTLMNVIIPFCNLSVLMWTFQSGPPLSWPVGNHLKHDGRLETDPNLATSELATDTTDQSSVISGAYYWIPGLQSFNPARVINELQRG